MKTYTKLILINLLGLSMHLQAYAQNQISAIAYPIESIVIDGDLSDWSADIPKYIIGQNHGDKLLNAEDFSASFMLGYNEREGCIYVGLEIIDDEHLIGGDDKTPDEALLYFDREHTGLGGAPFYYIASNNQLELLKKSDKIDPYNTDIKKENATVKVKRAGNRTNYEWKVALGNKVKKNTVLGIDCFLIDQDSEPKSESYLLWKDGFGKSQSTHKMGHVMLLEKEQPLGKIQGLIVSDSLIKTANINEIKIVSTENPDFWITTTVDTTGFYAATLPVGKYEILPIKRFTSPVYSGGFFQNTRRIVYNNKAVVEVKEQIMSQVDSLAISLQNRPQMPPITTKNKNRIEYLDTKEIDAFISEWQNYLEIPAVSIALIRDNAVFYERTSGVKNLITKEAINQNTIFEAASISKSLFAVMILRLAERNIIDLDKPLFEYLPFPNIANDERSKLLTARIVLNHQSGLPNWAWDGPGTWKEGGEIKLNFEPGTELGYSGEAFNYLGRVIEKITEKKLRDLFKEEVAIPFGLENTYCQYNDEQENIMAIGHYHQYLHCKDREYLSSPASSVTTCANDLSKYVLGLMNEKNMSQESYNLLYTPYTILEGDNRMYDPEIEQYISHGFFVQDTEQGKFLSHGGNNGDYDCKFAYNKDKKYGYIIFTNSNLGDEFVRALEVFLFNRDDAKR